MEIHLNSLPVWKWNVPALLDVKKQGERQELHSNGKDQYRKDSPYEQGTMLDQNKKQSVQPGENTGKTHGDTEKIEND